MNLARILVLIVFWCLLIICFVISSPFVLTGMWAERVIDELGTKQKKNNEED